MSKNGKVVLSSWDYFAEAKSLLIDRGKDKILCNESFIDEGVMILKMDGTDNDFFVLANENVVPDLDVYKYLKKLRYKNLNIFTQKLIDGKILEIPLGNNEDKNRVGLKVTIESKEVTDGEYKLEEPRYKYLIKNSRIAAIIYEVPYKTKEGIEILVEQ